MIILFYNINFLYFHYMSKILATEIRIGNILEFDKKIWKVVKSHHVHVGGRGGAYMQVELRGIESGTKKNERIRTDEKVEKVYLDSIEMQFLFADNSDYTFMNTSDYEQITIDKEVISEASDFLLPNSVVQITFYDSKPIGITLPTSVILEVVETEPYVKNATSTGSFKQAKLENGISILVPQFIENNQKIKVNTDTREYMERV